MGALIGGVLILATVFVVIYSFVAADEKLEEKTGSNIGEWCGRIFCGAVCAAVAVGGLVVVGKGMSGDSTGLVVVGLILLGLGGILAWSCLFIGE